MASPERKIAWTKRFADELHAHFVPSERNGHVPHVLKHRVLIGYSLIVILLKALALTGFVFLPASSVYSSSITADNIVELTNASRTSLGLKELKVDPRLAQAATGKAEDMVINQYFAHTSPAGLTPWSWFRKAGYAYIHAGENLAVNFTSAEGVQAGWMASPEHHDNIVSVKYDDIGVGIARGTFQGYDTTFVVEMFGAPQPTKAAAPAPAPETSPAHAAPAEAIVAPTGDGYKVTLASSQVPAATAMIAGKTVAMAPDASGHLAADVPVDKTVSAAQPVYVLAADASGTPQATAVAFVAPKADTAQLYAATIGPPPFKLLGLFEITGLQDSVRRFYLLMSLLLGAALLASVAIKFEVQKHTVTLHALFVIGLALTMAFI